MSKRVAIIGAGIVGLHTAIAFRIKGWEVYLMDKESYTGHHTSTRNSGVVHAGIYYKEDSLKEKLCLRGNPLTLEWLKLLNVDHKSCGKWIIPGMNQNQSDLLAFYEKIKTLPLKGLRYVDPDQLKIEEPALKRTAALFVPATAVMDTAAYIRALSRFAENEGVNLLLNCELTEVKDDLIVTSRGPLEADLFINSTGLMAAKVAQLVGVTGYEVRPCRGDYYLLPVSPVSKPVYHPPSQSGSLGLGIHLTPATDGTLLLGPNAFFIDNPEDYAHKSPQEAFVETLRDHLPEANPDSLVPAYSGNRPKLTYQGQPLADFTFIKDKNWIHLLGIESPGLTSAPVIGSYILGMV